MEGGGNLLYSKIKEICKTKGISIRKLESDLEFSYGSVCKWNTNTPSFERITKVANYLSIPLDDFRNEGESV